jgi:hypothetical protein
MLQTYNNFRRPLHERFNRSAIERSTLDVVRKLTPMPPEPNDDDRAIHQERVKQYVRKQDTLLDNNGLLYSLIWGQCSDPLKQKLKALTYMSNIQADSDGIRLLEAIKVTMMNYQHLKNPCHAIDVAVQRFGSFRQSKHMSVEDFYDQFTNIVDVLKLQGGEFGFFPTIYKEYIKENGIEEATMEAPAIAAARAGAIEEFFATAFLRRADPSRYGLMLNEIENGYSRNRDEYPKDLNTAYNYLLSIPIHQLAWSLQRWRCFYYCCQRRRW